MKDPVAKRILVAWLAVFILGWYVSQIANYSYNLYTALVADKSLSFIRDWSLLLQWSVIFSGFALGLYLAQIPRLQFCFRHLCIICLVILFSQWLVFHSSSPVSVRSFTERFFHWYTGVDDWSDAYSLTVDADEISTLNHAPFLPEKLRPFYSSKIGDEEPVTDGDADSLITGSFTLKVIPHSSAQMNPDGRNFCRRLSHTISANAGAVVAVDEPTEIPVVLSGIPPWTIEYSASDYITSEEQTITAVVNWSDAVPDSNVDDFVSVEDKKLIHRFSINATAPGVYRLLRLTDAKGPGTVSTESVEISVCPEAFWSRRSLGKEELISKDLLISARSPPLKRSLCRFDQLSVELLVFGVPPLSVSFIRQIDGKFHHAENVTVTHIESGESAVLPTLGKSKSFFSQVNLGSADLPVEHLYHLTKVIDGTGMMTEYAQDFDADLAIFHVNDRPEASLLCDPNKPMEILTQDIGTGSSSSPYTIPVSILSKNSPFNLSYSVTMPDGSVVEKRLNTLTSNRADLIVQGIGTYSLRSISDAQCSGTVSRQTCKVLPFTVPSINIQSGLIETPCFGQIGFSFRLQFTGVSPWTVRYTLKRDDGPAQAFTLVSTKPTEIVEIKPPNPGKYEVQFVEFTDSHYPRPVTIENVIATQSFHAPSSATLERFTKRLCAGDEADISVKLTGSGPWSLTYEIISGNTRTSLHIPDISASSYSFKTPPLNQSRVYYIELKTVLDSNGCETPITSSAAQVEVLDKRPIAAFSSPISIPDDQDVVKYNLIEGKSISLSLFMSGFPPFRVELEHSDDGVKNWKSLGEQTFTNLNGQVQARRPGFYRIKRVKDQVCSGSPAHPNMAELSLVDKPAISLLPVESLPLAVCIGGTAGWRVRFTGRPPFVLGYKDSLECNPAGLTGCRPFSSDKQIRLATLESEIPFDSSLAGERTITLLWISDENYDKIEINKDRGFATKLTVYPAPSARFVKLPIHGHRAICTKGTISNDGSLGEIELKGKSPWLLELATEFESGAYKKEISRENFTITVSPLKFKPSQDFSTVGRYIFSLRRLKDANGCLASFTGFAGDTVPIDQSVSVEVYPEPTLTMMDSRPYSCVGDTLEYHLSGIPPWRIMYQFTDAAGKIHEKVMTVDAKGDGAAASSLFSFITKRHASLSMDESEQSRRLIIQFAQPGSFSFRSLCHGPAETESGQTGGWCCKDLFTGDPSSLGTSHVIHPLPGASINQGKHSVDVIREGGEAVMRIDFTGTLPFSFTYVRKSSSGIELDSHSIANIQANHYEIPLSQEGTFHLTSVADSYCKFPRAKRRLMTTSQ